MDSQILPNEDMEIEEDDELESPDATQAMENMAISFLQQLDQVFCSDDDPGSSEDDSPGTKSSIVRLQLTDRTKRTRHGTTDTKYISYPRKCTTGSARPFAQLFHVLDSMHESVISGVPVTKRDIYYKDVPLLKTQRTVDNLVDDLAATFDLERSQLNVRATSKGLICGSSLTFRLNSGTTLCPSDTDGSLIPVGEDIQTFSLTEEISWVLIVEKDAIFQHLCRLQLTKHPSLQGRGLLITGKGYPDMATRHLVKTLSDNLPTSVPIMALVDGDAFGIDILSVYKYGSRALQHENYKLAAGRVKWLGLWSSELATLGIDRDTLIPISKHDEKKVCLTFHYSAIRKELMHMLHNRRKAEIEILYTSRPDASPGNNSHPPLLQYLITKITSFVSSAKHP
ncbi:DNA topoisomerase IV, alpha subunit [Armillaria gallica]|uniref:DNA topoisomerase (ATP-hydrolyzing) n=1 Tax=Armillaria gallica TaxID=47427 RepID=A0A2H3E6H6_ARMGA|nr:DNA topoisomerase IV, alpha subunit [Armillaria gallica]